MGMTECKGYDYLSYRQWLEELCRKYTFLNAFTIGKSCLGRDIVALGIGKTNEYALITAAFHGSEYITSTVLMFFIEELCKRPQCSFRFGILFKYADYYF